MSSDVMTRFEGVEVTENPRPPLEATPEQLLKMLKIIENDIIPLTEKGVETGNKMFGAAIIDSDFNCIHPDTNAESQCPTFHAEVKCIVSWSENTPAKDRGPIAQSSIFLATHEPCMMCVSSILWGGWNKCWYFFGYQETSAQGIPHDINTMHELWGVNTYRKRNKYLSTSSIMEAIKELPDSDVKTECLQLQEKLIERYEQLSTKYHTDKVGNKDNSLVLA
mmetsp:Transcript_28699/g.77719  ORF Transcript_28699/g.77719 Transcript_28699/m.77719 type:complete len:222 (+) Transcript_28699:195-860(+)|eukprot:CAMPEP_0172370898 /NCGR_PEP_ID=MMETSP1060-20121228/40292_1 /TAXON_ID=37318 /ORGANISM="Pseudo-nitzschia pungens, Strain cf. cingulata" /LENGTH=221 /DNA_ID=CAMNT_0013096353 /DNA_START=176 /DNA_END=841 /DNA_ORIENTATION=-